MKGLATAPWETKRLAADGAFAGYASVFDLRDAQGDTVTPGAFAADLARWRERGRLPPLLWQHDLYDPIGRFEALGEDRRGLRAEGRLALESPRGAEAYRLMKAGAIDGLSIGYTVVLARAQPGGGRLLLALSLHEISLVTVPANDAARVVEVKGTRPALDLIITDLRRAAAALR